MDPFADAVGSRLCVEGPGQRLSVVSTPGRKLNDFFDCAKGAHCAVVYRSLLVIHTLIP